jgi:6-pyruvoyltetrahydropterin/6-carboxytetrahydropterin synthase
MYKLCLRRDFTARHFLVGGDWGEENMPHGHAYRLEWELSAPGLDRNGYVADLVDVEKALTDVLSRYRDALLNDLEEFSGVNPSLERFAFSLWQRLSARLGGGSGMSAAVRLWENDTAWASYGDG